MAKAATKPASKRRVPLSSDSESDDEPPRKKATPSKASAKSTPAKATPKSAKGKDKVRTALSVIASTDRSLWRLKTLIATTSSLTLRK